MEQTAARTLGDGACTVCPGCRDKMIIDVSGKQHCCLDFTDLPEKRKHTKAAPPCLASVMTSAPEPFSLPANLLRASTPVHGLFPCTEFPTSPESFLLPPSTICGPPPLKRPFTYPGLSITPGPSPNQPSAPQLSNFPLAKKVNLKPKQPINPADLPAARSPPIPNQPCIAAVQEDEPLMIHKHTVQDYRQIYHEVVDQMLRYKSGRLRPYSVKNGRRITRELWKRMNNPTVTTSVNQDGLISVDITYGSGPTPPLHILDTLGEPKPKVPKTKRTKLNHQLTC